MAKKQHQYDRERSSGYREKALCGRDMPRENTWGFESCERCADVARARKDKVMAASLKFPKPPGSSGPAHARRPKHLLSE